jgi:hypothetical protein
MSNNLYLIDLAAHGLPEPATLQEFWDQIQPRIEQPAQPNPKFIALADRLADWKPASSDDEEDQNPRWPIDPREQAPSLRTAVWVLGLPSDSVAEALHHVVNEATELGVAVLADYLGVGFLPGQKTVSANPEEQWDVFFDDLPEEVLRPERMTLPKLRESLREMLAPRLEVHGFKFVNEYLRNRDGSRAVNLQSFVRNCRGGRQATELHTWKAHGRLYFSMSAVGLIDPVHDLMKTIGVPLVKSIFDGDFGFSLASTMPDADMKSLGVPANSEYGACKSGSDELDVDAVLRYYAAFERYLIPVLDDATSVQGLHKRLNIECDVPPGSHVRSHGYNRVPAILAAYLAGDPSYRSLLAQALTDYPVSADEFDKRRRAPFEKVEAYLQKNGLKG